MQEPKPEDRARPTPGDCAALTDMVRRTSLAHVLASLRDVVSDEAIRFAEEADEMPMKEEADEFRALALRWFRAADRLRQARLFIMRQNV